MDSKIITCLFSVFKEIIDSIENFSRGLEIVIKKDQWLLALVRIGGLRNDR